MASGEETNSVLRGMLGPSGELELLIRKATPCLLTSAITENGPLACSAQPLDPQI